MLRASFRPAGTFLAGLLLLLAVVAAGTANVAAQEGPVFHGRGFARRHGPFPITHVRRPFVSRPPQREPQVHRHEKPETPIGPFVPNPNPYPPTSVRLPGGAPEPPAPQSSPRAPTDSVVIVRNNPLGTAGHNGQTSTVNEPSVATNGNIVLYVGNWFASLSQDGGRSFRYIDPFTFFPSASGGFCCDQVVHYIPQIDTFVWLLQYIQDASGNNTDRLAFATSAEIVQNRWRTFDVTSQRLGLSAQWLDFPDLAVGANSLYLTTNVFDNTQPVNRFTRTLILRFPLSGIAANNVTFDSFESTGVFNFRPAQNCGNRMFFAAHVNTSTLRVFSWDEGSTQVNNRDIAHATYSRTGYTSNTPDNFDWLGFMDDRIEGGALAGNTLWFSWAAAPGGASGRPHSYTEVVRLNASTLTLIDQPAVWNSTFAMAYAALGTNSNGEVGISISFGGPQTQVSHAVGILTGSRQLVVTATGTNGPAGARWGDYLTVRQHRPNTKLFAATGFTLQGGTGNQNAEPRFILFGRSSETVDQTVTLTAPNGGEVLVLGLPTEITWTSAGFQTPHRVRLELSRDGGATFESIADSVDDTGRFTWTPTAPASNTCRIRVTSLAVPLATDTSDANFRLVAGALTVTAPNGGELLFTGARVPITWEAVDFAASSANVRIELSRDGGLNFETLFNAVPNDGSHDWTVTGPPTLDAVVRITAVTQPAFNDTSDAEFEIREPSTIRVQSPNGGEFLVAETAVDLQWTSTGLVDTVRIELSRNGGVTWETLFPQSPNDGVETWVVSGPATRLGRIRITSTTESDVSDLSDGVFEVQISGLRVTGPAGGQRILEGRTETITWTSSGLSPDSDVSIEVSLDGGGTWSVLSERTLNDGSHPWGVRVPVPSSGGDPLPTRNALIRVASLELPGIAAVSQPFGIERASLFVVSPNGRERWSLGSQEIVTWSGTTVGMGRVRVQLSRDGGVTWETILRDTQNDGAEAWGVRGRLTKRARIRVIWLDDTNVADQGDGLFQIARGKRRR